MPTAKAIEAGLDQDGHATIANERFEPPPIYRSNSSNEAHYPPPPPQSFPIDYLAYQIPNSAVSDDQTTRYVPISERTAQVEALKHLLDTQAALSPRPLVRIKGTHIDKLYSWGATRTDFDLAIDATAFLVPSCSLGVPQASTTRVDGMNSEESLRHWLQRFCDGLEKCIILEQVVTNWDTESLRTSLIDLVRSLKYQGTIEITFPIQHSKIILLREGYGTPNPTTSHIQSIWRYTPSPQPSQRDHSQARHHADFPTTSNPPPILLQIYHKPLLNAILSRRTGYITHYDWMDAHINNITILLPTKDWGTTTEDWTTLMKGMKIGGAKKAAPGDFARAMWLGSGVRK